MRGMFRSWIALVEACAAGAPALGAQMEMQHSMVMYERPLGIPEARMGSGTSWVPDDSPMHDAHTKLGNWTVMLHGSAFLQYEWQGGPRGATQLGLVNWVMASAARSVGSAALEFRTMLSAEPWTIGRRGYPLLLQSGESADGLPLHDRQHPHELFMELAALYQRPVADNLALSLYFAPVGEPALGPVAFPHRPSAADNPLAPISHHWQDATHVSFGVLTAGLLTRTVQLEGSIFNGREPDEDRTDVDYAGRRLDSYALRLTVNPGPVWSWSAWYGYLKSPELLHPDEALHRFGVSALTTQSVGRGGSWASALIWGANAPLGARSVASSVVLESDLDLDGAHAVFARAEYVRKRAEDLAIPTAPPTAAYDVGMLALGAARTVAHDAGLSAAVGIVGSLNVVPPSLANVYGGRAPGGFAVYLRVRPAGGQPAPMVMSMDH
jgi:hypothetical protein